MSASVEGGRRAGRFALFFVLSPFFVSIPAAAEDGSPPPRLVLQITVDQLRGDLLRRYRASFSAGGFRRLMEQGVYYTNAHYGASNTFTAAGHAVLVTGADTAQHGMVANEWFDREAGRHVNSIYDAKHGQSPANLSSSTVGDELVWASDGRARVFAVAGKDRSAIIPGGHLGKAFWFSSKSGEFVSSSYYYPALPDWVRAWNAGNPMERYRRQKWSLLADLSTYRNAQRADNVHARSPEGLGRTFPHASDHFSFTPFLDEYTLAFARELIRREALGADEITDYLSLSLSATDYIGHAFGPNSLESEDNLRRLDLRLAELFDFLDRVIGLEAILIVLSADHGVDEIPEERLARGYDARRFHPQQMIADLNVHLGTRFGTDSKLVAAFSTPGLYLDRARIASLGLDSRAVEAALAEWMRGQPGIAYAFTRSDLLSGRVPDVALVKKVQRGFHPRRSGDVILVQEPFWYLHSDAEGYAAMHGSPYSYDSFVPVIFMGPGLMPRHISRPIEPAAVAPTLAALLAIQAPSGCTAQPLMEILDSGGGQ